MEKVKLLTRMSSFQDVEKAFQELEKTLNELKQSVNTEAEGMVSDTKGKSGDIKLTQKGDKSYLFEIRTKDGWKTPVVGESAVSFREKPPFVHKDRKKTITELEAEDTSTGDTKAKKTIYDEKNDEFSVKHLTAAQTGGLMKPDYDSGWVTWDFSEYTVGADNPLTLTHSLGALPTTVTVLFAPGQATDSVTWWSPLPSYLDDGYDHGLVYKVTSTQILLLNGENQTYVSSDFANPGAKVVYQDGSIKVLIWK